MLPELTAVLASVGVVLLTAVSGQSHGQKDSNLSSATIAGNAIDAETGAPVQGATVSFSDSELKCVTGPDGAYSFNVKLDRWTRWVMAYKEGYGLRCLPVLADEAKEYACEIAIRPLSKGKYNIAEKAPFKVLYNSDTSNILSCPSPYNKTQLGKTPPPFRAEMLEANIDEAVVGTDVDVFLQSPGEGWIPMWKSEVYPDHFQWYLERKGRIDPKRYGRWGEYMLSGGDLLAVLLKHCRKRGVAPFVTFRVNDWHLPPIQSDINVSRFYHRHPEYRLGPDINDGDMRVHNWAIPETRAYKLALIEEICENYDIDGLELDFMRHLSFFRTNETTSEERVRIMTDFVRQVRGMIDRTSTHGKHRWLGVRIPVEPRLHDKLGINVSAMVEAGAEMVNFGEYYRTVQQVNFAKLREMTPDEAAYYLEMTYCTVIRPDRTCLRTRDEQFYTTAHLAYARGVDGVSFFNFQYFRTRSEQRTRSGFHEPPFHVFKHLADREWLARQPQHFFIYGFARSQPMPITIVEGKPAIFDLDMEATADGWQTNGKLRIQGDESLNGTEWRVTLNGVELESTMGVSVPYRNPYLPFGDPDEYRAWVVPVSILKEGINTAEVALVYGSSSVLVWLGLAVE